VIYYAFILRGFFGLVPAFFRRMQTRMSTNVILLFILEALNRVVGEEGTEESRAATPFGMELIALPFRERFIP
jgi:hypothetical protein